MWGDREKCCNMYFENSDGQWWLGNHLFVTIVINVSLYSWWWVEKPTAVLTRLKKKAKRKRDTEKDPHHRVSRSVGTERKRDTSHTEEENRRSVCQQVLRAFRQRVRERWRERESEQLLIWTHRPSPVSAHSNVCPARLTRPRVAPITHNPALPTASARHRFEGFTEQILAVVHIKVEPSPCVV